MTTLPVGAVDMPTPPNDDDFSTAEVDDDFLVLSDDQRRQLELFRREMHRTSDDDEKYKLCAQVRDELLPRYTGLELLVAAYDDVMFAEYPEYKKLKNRHNITPAEPTRLSDGEAAQWNQFMAVAKSGSDSRSRCLVALRTVSRYWGADMVQHYGWASRGAKYCSVLCSAARQVRNRDEGVTKLNWLMLQRSRLPRRRPLRDSVNPIDQIDLTNLRAWPGKDSFVSDKYPDYAPLLYKQMAIGDLPDGFGFDKFGLMVQKEYAVPLPETSSANTMGKSASVEVNVADTADHQEFAVRAETCQAGLGLDDSSFKEFVDTILTKAENDAASEITTRDMVPKIEQSPPPVAATDDTGDVNSASGDRVGRVLRPRAGKPPSYQARVVGGRVSKSKHAPLTPAKVAKMLQQRRCCPPKVPSEALSVLENPSSSLLEIAEQCAPHIKQFCHEHLLKYAEAALTRNDALTRLGYSHADRLPDAIDSRKRSPARRRRAASLSYISPGPPVSKRQRLDDEPRPIRTGTEDRPEHDSVGDHAYLENMRGELEEKLQRSGKFLNSHGEGTDNLIREILKEVQQPNTDKNRGMVEAYFSTASEAAALVEASFPDGPIFTQGQQQFRWGDHDRPIAQFFRRMEDLDRSVSVQVPSRRSTRESFERRKLSQVCRRFLGEKETDDPWNILDLQNPLPPCTLPGFLTGENCQLLSRVRDAVLMGDCAERPVASRDEWGEWRDVLEWALLSEGGHNTAPHTDGNGLATWITVQEGRLGFGWMASPTQEEQDRWTADPGQSAAGRWRYVVLRAGQTVVFRPGMIHFVFRLRATQTLALGGHFLQWSGVDRWMRIVLTQMRNPSITNEDMEWDAPRYVRVVAELVGRRVREGRVRELGGEETVMRFFGLVEEFERIQLN